MVPYPPPPRMNGPIGNPARQPTFGQAVALLAGFGLLILIAIAAVSGNTLLAGAAIAAGAVGFLVGWVTRSNSRRPAG